MEANDSRETPHENPKLTVDMSDIREFERVVEAIKDLELQAIKSESVASMPLVDLLVNNQNVGC